MHADMRTQTNRTYFARTHTSTHVEKHVDEVDGQEINKSSFQEGNIKAKAMANTSHITVEKHVDEVDGQEINKSSFQEGNIKAKAMANTSHIAVMVNLYAI